MESAVAMELVVMVEATSLANASDSKRVTSSSRDDVFANDGSSE